MAESEGSKAVKSVCIDAVGAIGRRIIFLCDGSSGLDQVLTLCKAISELDNIIYACERKERGEEE